MCYRVNRGMYPLGYSTPEEQTLLHKAMDPPVPPPRKYMFDNSLKLSHDQQMFICKEVAEGRFSVKKAGRSGTCSILEKLAYLDYNNIFLMPVAHGLLNGLVKDFFNTVLQKVRCTSQT